MSIFKKLWEKIQSILKVVPKRIREIAEQTQPIVNRIKEAVESDTAATLTRIIPSEIDDTIREVLIEMLGRVSVALTKAPNEAEGVADQLDDLIEEIKQLPEALRNGAYAKLSAMLLAYRDDWKEEREAMYDLYSQILYIKSKN